MERGISMPAIVIQILVWFAASFSARLVAGVVAYVGVDAVARSFLDDAKHYLNEFPAAVLQLLKMSGFTEGFSMLLTALGIRLTILGLKKIHVIG